MTRSALQTPRLTPLKSARLLALWALLVLAFCVICAPQVALAKDYVIDSVNIHAQLNADGSMGVTEKRTFDFSGSFSYVYWDLPVTSNQTITFTKVTATDEAGKTTTLQKNDGSKQPGTFSVSNQGDSYRLTARMPASDEKLTYTLSYTETNVVEHYEDAAHLYWQFIGKSWGVETRVADITIVPPSALSKDQVRAWAHGPLNGLVSIGEDGAVTLHVTDLPAETFVEARVLYPSASFSAAPLWDGTITNKVLSEEKTWADEANAQRASAKRTYWGAMIVGILGGLSLFGLITFLFIKYGREHKSFIEFDGKYWREDPRPDLPPAMIGSLWRFGKVTMDDVTASILDMADRKVIVMNEVEVEKKRLFGAPKIEKEYHFTVDRVKLANEHDVHQDLMDIILKMGTETKDEFTFESIKKYAEKNPKEFSEEITDWQNNVKGRVEIAGLIEAQSNTMRVVAIILTIALGVLGAIVLDQQATIAAILCFVLCVPSFFMTIFMKRRSVEGHTLYRRYEGIRNYLKDFSRLDEYPPNSIVVWNRFLVLATVFGIAEQVARDLKVVMPEMVNSQDFAMNYWWFYGANVHGASPFEGLSSTLNAASAQAIASSASSSAGGFGGGFSGGGGFGGGGGGGGAG